MKHKLEIRLLRTIMVLLLAFTVQVAVADNRPVKRHHQATGDSITIAADTVISVGGGSLVIPAAADFDQPILPADSIGRFDDFEVWEPRDVEFNPDPNRAVWMSALFPGLGQVYNRRYWKLPIVVGGFMGLGYATSWNNGMLTDYTRAYRDIMDNDPNTNSYMNLFPPNTQESSLDKTWLTNILQSRKNFYRRNRDLCIIAMVGVYFIAMVDAYVDASLSHFDISPDLTLDMTPAVMRDSYDSRPSFGLVCAFTF